MKRKILSIFLLTTIFSTMLTGCLKDSEQHVVVLETDRIVEDTADGTDEPNFKSDNSRSDAMEELLQDTYGDYKEKGGEIAFVANGVIMDDGYNKDIYDGIQVYGLAAGISFSVYVADEENPEKYREIIERAIDEHARIIVCAGYEFGEAVGELQELYPETAFLLVDGVPVDKSGKPVAIKDNVHCISFHEEEAGYLAGYMAVLEGYRKLGFIGGVSEPPIVRYGYGYLQGIDDAAVEIGAEDVTVNYWYAETFEPNSKITEEASKWYTEGTEIIFACGGYLYESVLIAADREDGLLIGVDVDQSAISKRFLTSAIKDTSGAVVIALDDFYATGMRWSEELAGQEVLYGIQDNCTGIPIMDTDWRFENVTLDDIYEVCKQIKLGEIKVSDKINVLPEVSFTINYDVAGE